MRHPAFLGVLLILVATACTDGVVSPRGDPGVLVIDSVAILPNNILGLRVHASISGADSAWVLVTSQTDGVQQTPEVRVTEGANELLVLGLRQGTQYSLQVVARTGAGALRTSGAVPTTVDSVPAPLRALRLEVTGTASKGFTLFSAAFDTSTYVVAFDSIGNIRWYHGLSALVASSGRGEIRQLRGGGFLVYVGQSQGWQPVAGRYVQIAPDGSIVRSIYAPVPTYMDGHEIVPLYTSDSLTGTIFFSYDLRTIDMRAYGGSAVAQIAGHYVVRQRVDGINEFFWSGWDHFTIDDWIEEPTANKTLSPIDFDHPNALDIDLDGNYVVSWRSLAEVTKIDAKTGAIIWRLGGANNQFTFQNDPLGFFSGQHSIRVLPNGNYLLFDNGLRHSPPESRAVEYRVDAVARTATMVWQFRATPAIFTRFTGSAQRLANGNTLIGWAGVSRASEVTTAGQTVWEATLVHPRGAATYRATRIPSLYRGGVP